MRKVNGRLNLCFFRPIEAPFEVLVLLRKKEDSYKNGPISTLQSGPIDWEAPELRARAISEAKQPAVCKVCRRSCRRILRSLAIIKQG